MSSIKLSPDMRMPESVEVIQFGKRAKIMTNKLGLRPTITEYAKKAKLFIKDVKYYDHRPNGVEEYDAHDFYGKDLSHAQYAQMEDGYNEDDMMEDVDDNGPTVPHKGVVVIMCSDEQGNSVTLIVNGFKPFMYLQLPSRWAKSACQRNAKDVITVLEKRLRVLPGSISYTIENGMKAYGYRPDKTNPRNRKQYTYMRLAFPNMELLQRCAYMLKDSRGNFKPIYVNGFNTSTILKPEEYKTGKFSAEHKFMDEMKLKYCSFIEVDQWQLPNEFITHTQVEIECHKSSIKNVSKDAAFKIPPLVIATFDTEWYSKNYVFPVAGNPEDVPICINTTVRTIDQHPNEAKRFSHHVGTVQRPDGWRPEVDEANPPPEQQGNKRLDGQDIQIFTYDNGTDMLASWRDFMVHEVDPDFILTYNGDAFDWKYMATYVAATTPNKIIGRQKWDGSLEPLSRFDDDDDIDDLDELVDQMTLEDQVGPQSKKKKKKEEAKSVGGTVVMYSDSRFFRQGRFIYQRTPLTKKVLSSAAKGDNKLISIPMPGRVNVDLFLVIKDQYKLGSYKLNDVAMNFLGVGKVKMDFEDKALFKNWDKDDEARFQNVYYCAIDTDRTDELAHVLNLLQNCVIMMSNVTLTSMFDVVTRGQQIRVWSMILQGAHARNFIFNVPDKSDIISNDDGYSGATVLEPKVGFYDTPVDTLDFASLYPSIMIIILKEKYLKFARAHGLDVTEIQVDPENPKRTHYFIKDGPNIVADLLVELKKKRKEVQAEQEKYEKGSVQWQTLEALQLAIKVVMNSFYGFTGVQNGMMPCMKIAESVTFLGRQYILETKHIVEVDFAHYHTEVVYGDTDSVFVHYKDLKDTPKDLEEACRRGNEIAKKVTEYLRAKTKHDIIKLENEKLVVPLVLFRKKKYIGKFYMISDGRLTKGKVSAKGVAQKRRDNCSHMRDNYTAMMDAVFEKKDQNQAKSILLNVINDIVNDKVPLEKYVISKSLKLSYSYEQGPDPETGKVPPPPHQAAVRDKMRERAPGKEPKSGDRVPFVMTWTGKEDDKKWKMAEDPNYVRDSNGKIKINRLYYLEFVKPIFSEFMEPMFEGVDKVFDNAIEMVRSQMKGLVSLANFFGPQSVLGKKRTREDDKQRIDTLAMDESDDNGSASDQPKAKRAALNDETREHQSEMLNKMIDNVASRDKSKEFVPAYKKKGGVHSKRAREEQASNMMKLSNIFGNTAKK